MSNYKANVGNVELVSLTDGHGDVDPVDTFPDSSMNQWRSEYGEFLDNKGHIHPRLGSVAVYSNGRLIIVDTGLQDSDGRLLEDMKLKGVNKDEVDIVVMTHIHPDHVGWNFSSGLPTFPKARYLVPKADWEYWTQTDILKDAPHVRDQVIPLKKLQIIDLISGDYNITNELTAIPTPGHTPGHISIAISSSGHRGFILGDLVHSPAQAHYTDWSPIFDVNGSQARETRLKVLKRLEDDRSLVSAGHLPDTGFGHFVRIGTRRYWEGI